MHTTTAYEVHTTFKNKNKRKSLRDNSVYHFLFLFVYSGLEIFLIETRANDKAHVKNAMSSFIIQSM